MMSRAPLTPFRMASDVQAEDADPREDEEQDEHAAEAERREADEARHQNVGDDAAASSATISTRPCLACHCTSASCFSTSSGTSASSQRYASTIITPRFGEASMSAMSRRVYDILEDMPVEQAAVLEALKVVRDPDLHRDIVSLGFIKDLKIDGGRVAFTIELTTPACPVKDQMRDQARAAVLQRAGRRRRSTCR